MGAAREAATPSAGYRAGAAGAAGAALLVAAVMSAGVGVAAVVCEGALRLYLALLAVGLPALLLQDAYRFVLLEFRGSRGAAVNDSCWTVTQLGASAVVLLGGGGAALHFGAWLAGAAAAAAAGAWQCRTPPRLVDGARFVGRTRRLAVPLVLEAFAISGTSSAAQFAVASVGGLAAVAPLRGAQVLLGPVGVVTGGLLFMVTPTVLRIGVRDRSAVIRPCAVFAAVLATVGLVGAAAVLVVPDTLGFHVLGTVWDGAQAVAVPLGLATAAGGIQTAAMLGFRACEVVDRTAIVHAVAFPLSPLGALVGLWWAGVAGAAFGMAAVRLVVAVGLWTMLVRHVRRSPAIGIAEGAHQ